MLPLPSKELANSSGRPTFKYLGMAWNAQAPIAYANGGARTTKGSLMDQAGVNFEFIRQDSYNKQIAGKFDLLAKLMELLLKLHFILIKIILTQRKVLSYVQLWVMV